MAADDPHRKHQFRQLVKQLHPDAGGDPEEFLAAMERWRTAQKAPRAGGRDVVFYRRRRTIPDLRIRSTPRRRLN